MKIYLDDNFKCHATNDGSMREVETDFFNGKCAEFIEGYIYDDRNGIAIYAWKPYSQLVAIQTAVDRAQDAADEKQMELLDIIENLILEG